MRKVIVRGERVKIDMSGKKHWKTDPHELVRGLGFSQREIEAMIKVVGDELPHKLQELMTEAFYQDAAYLGLTPTEYAYSLLVDFGPSIERIIKATPLPSPEERGKRMEAARGLLKDFSNEDFSAHRRKLAAKLKEIDNAK